MKPILGITLGEATGIGPELIAKLIHNNRLTIYCYPVIIGDARVLELGKKIASVDFPVTIVEDISAIDWDGPISILDTKNFDPTQLENCIGGVGLTHCIEQGVDVIEHAYFATDEQIEQLVKLNRWVVVTPRIFFNDARWATISQEAIAEFQYNREEVKERHQKIVQSGVKFAVGTDASHGEFAEDVILLTELGDTAGRALQAATISAARVSEMDDLVGSIESGKFADFVAVKGDLESDIKRLRSVCFVMKGGKVYRDEI